MRIACLSDMHGTLPTLPPCDLILIAGDVCPNLSNNPYWDAFMQHNWLRDTLDPWLTGRPPTFACWGNHDWVGERMIPPELPWTVVGVGSHGSLRIRGVPYTRRYGNWAHMTDESTLAHLWPDECDILLTHGPPFGVGDTVAKDTEPLGSPSLLAWIEAKQPKLVVCGHIHGGRGVYRVGETVVVNAALLDEQHRPQGEPIIVEIP